MRPLLLAALLVATAVGAQTRPAANLPAGSAVAGARSAAAAGDRVGPGAGVPAADPQPATAQATLFAASWCAYCRQARAYLARVRIKYQDVDIDSPAGKAAYEAAGGGGVPLLVYRGEQLRGFSELAYDYFFARYE